MPLYEYKCLKCGRHTERIENFSGPHLKKCPHCSGKVERVLAPSAIQFKGSGWYATDYAAKSTGTDSPKPPESDPSSAGESKPKEAASKEKPAKEKKSAKKD